MRGLRRLRRRLPCWRNQSRIILTKEKRQKKGPLISGVLFLLCHNILWNKYPQMSLWSVSVQAIYRDATSLVRVWGLTFNKKRFYRSLCSLQNDKKKEFVLRSRMTSKMSLWTEGIESHILCLKRFYHSACASFQNDGKGNLRFIPE